MKKKIYDGQTFLKKTELEGLKESSELVHEQTGQASYLMNEIYHNDGATLAFHYWFSPKIEGEPHMTELTVFGGKDKISKIEKELS